MTEETKRVSIEREPHSVRESGSENDLSEEVTNDSLGTTDIADSTGLDPDQPGADPKIDRGARRKKPRESVELAGACEQVDR